MKPVSPEAGAGLAARIDHTLLKPETAPREIDALCGEARRHGFRAVCINPVFVPLARRRLEGSGVRVCTVVGFPLGADAPGMKAAAARRAVEDGADDVDMVLFIGGLLAGQAEPVRDDIRGVVEACRAGGALCKVILETCLLDGERKRLACDLCAEAGADFVKTSTGLAGGGATEADVARLKELVGPRGLGVKASGGIRTRADALRMIAAGADVVGSSSSVRIVAEAG